MSKNPLILPALQIPEEGMRLETEVRAALLDLPAEDRLEFRHPVSVRLRISRRTRDVTVRGTLATVLTGRCDRCLNSFEEPLHVSDLCVFLEDVQTDTVNLTAPLREDILLALPNQLLCRDECLGLCPGCGRNRNHEPCQCPTSGEESPEVWAQLENLNLPESDDSEDRAEQ